jgi:hypothetical protein
MECQSERSPERCTVGALFHSLLGEGNSYILLQLYWRRCRPPMAFEIAYLKAAQGACQSSDPRGGQRSTLRTINCLLRRYIFIQSSNFDA